MSRETFEVAIRLVAEAVAGGWPQPLSCPACGMPLSIHQPDSDVPHRLLATCACEECGIWFALVPSVDRSEVFLVRIPAIVELREALARAVRA